MFLRKIVYYLLIVILIIIGPSIPIVWKVYIEPNWGTVDVIQVIKPIDRGAKISDADVTVAKIKADYVVVGGTGLQLKDVIDKEAIRSIKVNEQMTKDLVNTKHLYPNKDEWNMPLPAEWIFGKPPGSLLRGDHISLLPIRKEDVQKIDGKTENKDSSYDLVKTRLTELGVSPEDEKKLEDIVVSYAKGSNNKEVSSANERKDPNGVVLNIEFIVNEEQKSIIRNYGNKGYKFLIVYR